MRAITIDLARGADQSVDPRVAPNGTVARAQDCRIDRLGRLVARRGYTSLGVTVQGNPVGGPGTLEPFDLHRLGDDLIVLGNVHADQSGIRGALTYSPTARGVWRGNFEADFINTGTGYMGIAPADSVRVVLSELAASQTDAMWCDVAVDSTGVYVALATSYEDTAIQGARVTVVDRTTGKVALHQNQTSITNPLARNVRILAIGTVFYLFEQVAATIQVRTWDSASATQFFGAATVIVAAGVSAIPARYDVSNHIGSTDYLIAYPTATGYTWKRFNSAHVQQTTTNVASLADAPVGICGATGETVNVVNIRAATGVELRTFNVATGVLAVGPTDTSVSAQVHDWCAVSRLDSATVQVSQHYIFGGADFFSIRSATTAAHVLQTMPVHDNCKPVSKIVLADGEPFIWETLGASAARPFGLTGVTVSTVTSRTTLAAIALDGAAPPAYAAATAPQKSAFVRGSGTRYYVGVVSLDPRDKTYRSNVIECQIFSGDRRQGVESGGSLYFAGGCTTQYDKRTVSEVGFETVPNFTVTESTLGSLTLLGAYTWQIVFRSVAANGEVTQSSPSAPVSLTLTGVNNRGVLSCATPYSIRGQGNQTQHGSQQFIDVYRTEAGGSIPRLVKSQLVTGVQYGAFQSVSDGAADSVQQSGNVLYTQGADGSVSGRLPLGLASPCTLIGESDGKLILGGLERDTQLHISVENRPGEAVGFVNDDLFFIQNPEQVTAVVAGSAGRRLVFGKRNVREIVGPGPNSAGVGDISEPVEIENRVGAVDWRSVCKTEHGVFFQSSALGQPRIYLLPEGGAGALDASQGVTDLLELYPVITSATRHDEEQLLTFTLQNSAGTDGRILHLDLKTSGMTKNGWVGRWLIDRVAACEGAPLIEIVEETLQVSPFEAPGVLTIDLPRGKRIGDRLIVVICAQVATTTFTTPTSYTLLANLDSTAGTLFAFERLLSTTAAAQTASLATTLAVNSTAVIVKTWLLRGAHASQAAEFSSVAIASGTSLPLATLTPSWGATNTLWLSLALNDTALFTQGFQLPLWRGMPTGFERFAFRGTSEGPAPTASSIDVATASRQLNAASLSGVTWTSAASTSAMGLLLGVRPLASGGTPVRASTQYRGRLVLCTATDVLQSDPAANGDLGSVVVAPELELADIYPMGVGGEGRHLQIVLLAELLGACLVTALCSYDNGANWTALRAISLDAVLGFYPGQTVRLTWTPNRRKIQGVRVKFAVSEAFQLASGATGGLALLQAQLFFEDLAGPSRTAAVSRGVSSS